jgi:ATP-binding cassette, subfamily B, bacterial PglK
MIIKQTFTRLFQLQSKADRRVGFRLLVLVTLMGFLEAAGIASIMPFLAIIGNPDIVSQNQLLNSLYSYLNNNFYWVESVDRFLIVLGFFSFVFILTITFLRIYTLFKMNKYIEISRHNLSKSILKNYLDQSYEFFLDRHSAELSKNMLSEVDQVIIEVLRPVIQMISYIFVLIAIITLLLLNNPLLAVISISVMLILYMTVYYSLRKKLSFYGDLTVESNKHRFKSAIEAIGGIKSIKLSGVEKLYLDSFGISSSDFTRATYHYQIYNQTPKHLLEAVAFGGIILLSIIFMWSDTGLNKGELGQVLPLLGLYAFATYRAQPALSAIYGGITGLRYGAAAVSNLYFELYNNKSLNLQATKHSIKENFDIGGIKYKHFPVKSNFSLDNRIEPINTIQLSRLSYKFPNAKKSTIQNINLSIEVGSCIGIIGGSGAGKTTLVDIILGLLKPEKGFIIVDDIKINKNNNLAWQKCLGYVPQEMFLIDATIMENIAFGVPKKLIDKEKVISSARMAHIHDFINNDLPEGYLTEVGERGVRISGGQRQRISIARALYNDPSLLIFDEATSALDPVTEKSVIKTIQSLSGRQTVIIVAHKLTAVKDCDSIILLDKGEIKDIGSISKIEKLHNDFFI